MSTPTRLPSTRRPPGAAAGRSRPTSMIEPGFSGLPTPSKPKRLSLLPQFARSSSAEHKPEQDVVESENRDPDVAQTGGMDEAKAQADRRAMPPPPTSRLSRAPSTRVPGSSQLGRVPSVRSHARTNSVQGNTAPVRPERTQSVQGINPPSRPEVQRSNNSTPAMLAAQQAATGSGHKRAPSTTDSGLMRAPSVASASQTSRSTGLTRTASVKPPQPKTHSRNNSATATPPAAGLRRANSVRPTSINTAITSQTPPAPSPTSPRKVPELRPSGKPQQPSSSRPTFSTFQQHYSPAKTALPKPPVPTSKFSRPAPTLEEDTSIPFDVAKQQIELLQLSLLHEASAQTIRQYSGDAKRKLGRKHAKLRKELEAIRASETAHQKLANLKALQAWCPDPSLLAENLQVLARVHKDVAAITHPESRYTELLHTFEDWVSSAEERMAGHKSGFVEPLPGSWREAHASTALKIRSLQREMATLPSLPEQKDNDGSETSLRVILGSCRSLVDGILRELDMMAKLEKEVLGQEKSRIDNAIGTLSLDNRAGRSWTPAWQKAT